MSPTVLFLEVNPSFIAAFQAAAELGLHVILARGASTGQQFELSELYNVEIIAVETWSVPEVEKALQVTGRKLDELVFVWTLHDGLVPLAGRLNRELANRYFSEDVIVSTKNKITMRERSALIPCHPRWNAFSSRSIKDVDKNLRYPLIIKPALGYSSIGVQKVWKPEELDGAVKNTISTLPALYDRTGLDAVRDVLVEECIDGKEISVDVLVEDGQVHFLGICEKSDMRAPYFEEISYALPANVSGPETTGIEQTTRELVCELGINNGPMHIEYIYNERGVFLLDIGLRIGGSGLVHDLQDLAYGINFAKAVFLNLLGFPAADTLVKQKDHAGLLFLIQVEGGGTVSSEVLTRTNLCSIPEFRKLSIFIEPGQSLVGYPSYSGLPGYCLFEVSGSPDQRRMRITEILRECQETIRVSYEIESSRSVGGEQ